MADEAIAGNDAMLLKSVFAQLGLMDVDGVEIDTDFLNPDTVSILEFSNKYFIKQRAKWLNDGEKYIKFIHKNIFHLLMFTCRPLSLFTYTGWPKKISKFQTSTI